MTKVVGAFVLDENQVLGRGAFGVVYAGWRNENDENEANGRVKFRQRVAIKEVPRDRVQHAELELVRSMNSEYVVHIEAMIEHSYFCYIVMEMCDCTLEEHLARSTAEHGMCIANVNVVMWCLAHGYMQLHERHIAHRDIKPQNILLKYFKDELPCEICHRDHRRIDSAKMADFGTCMVSQKSMYKLCGTPLYMAPEVGANVVSDTEYNSVADMWSIGVLLFQCLCGQVPFEENQLCRLFLQAASFNHAAYKCPPLPPHTPLDTPKLYIRLLKTLLDINFETRLTAPELLAAIESGISCDDHRRNIGEDAASSLQNSPTANATLSISEPTLATTAAKTSLRRKTSNSLRKVSSNLRNGWRLFYVSESSTEESDEAVSPLPKCDISPPLSLAARVPNGDAPLTVLDDDEILDEPMVPKSRRLNAVVSVPRRARSWLWDVAKTLSLFIVYNCNSSIVQLVVGDDTRLL